MKILTSVTYYYPYISGLTLHAQMISEALSKKGYKVSVLCMQHDKQLPSQEVINGVHIQRANPIVKISKGFLSWDYICKSILLVRKTDVVIVHLPQFEGIFPVFFAKVLGKRVLIFYHCDVVLPKGKLNKIIERVLYISNFITLYLADVILHSTEDFANNSPILSRFLKKIKYVYPPIKSYKTNYRIKKLLMNKIGKEQDFLIGVTSRLSADKGIEYLLEAIPYIKSNINPDVTSGQKSKIQLINNNIIKFKIVLAGPTDPVGEEDYKEKILDLIKKYKENIVFLGKLKDEEMGPFYSLLDVLVFPSVNSTESFGTVQVEAMMQGTPVVVSDLPGVRIPVRRTGMGMIVPIKDPEKLAGAIVAILKEKYTYIANKDKIIKEFLFTNTLKAYEYAIQNI